MKKHFLAACLVLLVSDLAPARAQEVVRHPDTDTALSSRWSWAESECGQTCWIGYSIQRIMGRRSYMGWSGNRRSPTLQSVIYGREVEPVPDDRDNLGDEPVLKEVALLFHYDGGTMDEVEMSNISLPVDLDGDRLVWIGTAAQPESVPLLESIFTISDGSDLKEDLVSVIGVHDADDLVVPFLTDVLESGEHDDVREQAVFWLAESEGGGVLMLLERTARTDASEDVREQAVFGISRIESVAADDLLIELARGLDDRDTREQAIFWLGHKASERAVENLTDIAANDDDVEIQKKAVFALSQLPKDDGIPRLISIARTHRNAEVRHDAIFWLGESGDERAVEELVRIVRGE